MSINSFLRHSIAIVAFVGMPTMVSGLHNITTRIGVQADGSMEPEREIDHSISVTESVPRVAVDVSSDGSQHLHKIQGGQAQGNRESSANLAQDTVFGDLAMSTDQDSAAEKYTGRSLVRSSFNATRATGGQPIQVITGELLPKVEIEIEKYAALNRGKCPSELPAVPGWGPVDEQYQYGAGCRGGHMCVCPNAYEECALGARITGSKVGSGMTTISTQLLGFCRTATMVYVASVAFMVILCGGVACWKGIIPGEWLDRFRGG